MSIDTGRRTGRPGVSMRGMRPLQNLINQLIAVNRDPTSIFRLIGERIRAMNVNHFDIAQDSTGRSWPDLSSATLARRGGDAKALLDTGRLRGSIAKKVESRAVYVGTNVKYAPFHQFRIPTPERPRQFLYINAEEADTLFNMLVNALIKVAFR